MGSGLQKFSFPSAGHDSRVWVVTKLVSEPRFRVVPPRLPEWFNCVLLNYCSKIIRFRHVFDQSYLFEYSA